VRKGQVDQAILHFQKALEIRPRFAEADYSLGNAFLEKRLASEAIAHFQRAVGKPPGLRRGPEQPRLDSSDVS